MAAMIFFPAIDLKEGRCVRLVQGELASATVFSDDPANQARAFAAAGCDWLHVVDLDGAFAGEPKNSKAVDAILDATDLRLQVGGGIRDLATITHWLERGVQRVILGTVALKDPDLVKQAAAQFPDRVALALDARDGAVATDGWSRQTTQRALDVACAFDGLGLSAMIYTDISRDGMMTGPNMEATLALARAVKTPVIASGGVSSMEDLRTWKFAGEGLIAGVIVGRALYEGRVDPATAVATLAAST
jgi:phosphoribosylformimino-5-aminoimidazole carboxamide ribotide isomerase